MENDDMSALLEQLRIQAGCDYISDLHNADYAWKISTALESIQPSDYTLNVWNSAIEYITGKRCSQTLSETAMAHLHTYFTSKNIMRS